MNNSIDNIINKINEVQGSFREEIINNRFGKRYEYPYWTYWGCYRVEDIGEKIPNEIDSIQIDLNKCSLADLKIPGSLECLSIVNLKDKNIKQLLSLPLNVKQLHIDRSLVSEINFIEHFTTLKHLHLANLIKIDNITSLNSLVSLETLVLAGIKRVEDFSSIQNLQRLKGLELKNGDSGGMPIDFKIESIDFIRNMNLEMIRLSFVKILDDNISPIIKNKTLKEVDIGNHYFTLDQMAQLSSRFDDIYNVFRTWPKGWSKCKKCHNDQQVIILNRLKKQICPNCQSNILIEYLSEFDKLVIKYRTHGCP